MLAGHEEYMATAVICSFLGFWRFTIVRSLQSACRDRHTRRQMHKLGALMAVVIAAAKGWNTIYFGPDPPADEIAAPAATHAGERDQHFLYSASGGHQGV